MLKRILPIFIALVFFSFLQQGNAQSTEDTIVVQTLTFDDITKRRDWYVFPDGSHTYRKVLMVYTLKCDEATTQDQFPCGEWDYLTYNHIWDHTGVMDSNLLMHPYFVVGKSAPEQIDLSETPVYDYFQTEQSSRNVILTNSEESYAVGNGNDLLDHPFNTSQSTQRVQYLWTASELSASGLTAGLIDQIQLDVTALGEALNNLRIRMKNTGATELAHFDNNNLEEVYHYNSTISGTGLQTLTLNSSFDWDGSSNLLIEFSFKNAQAGNAFEVKGSDSGFNSGVLSSSTDKYLKFDGQEHVVVPNDAFAQIDQEITISFWSYGNPDFQPENSYLFEGFNDEGRRVLNCHLPWSNGSIYWDAGATGGNYDRIFKAANPSEYAGQWNHWALTKNTTTGNMSIYLNGQLWHAGNGNTRSMAGVTSFTIAGKPNTGGQYHGNVDEFRIWNKALDAAEIQEWMNKSVTPSHPSYANLLYYYKFDEDGFEAKNEVNNKLDGSLIGAPQRLQKEAYELSEAAQVTSFRPNITLLRGDYTFTSDIQIVTDSVEQAGVSVVTYEVVGNDVAAVDTAFGWHAGYSYVYDQDGELIDSLTNTFDQAYDNYELEYYSLPFEVINRYEIGRFITPYGINLSLGSNGTTWMYDVTDYAFLLKDSVDFAAGNQQELIDVKFIMIEGTPAREVKHLDRIWGQRSSYRYGQLDNDDVLSATTLPLHPEASEFKVVTRLTGHGHNSNTGSYPHCCEWKDNSHYLHINGQQVADWKIFQYNECALNPVYPQGGTWPGAREGWCPGDVVKDQHFNITPYIDGDEVTIDYSITPVPTNNQGMANGNYQVAMHLVHYGAANYNLDAELYDIISPSEYDYYERLNPICRDAKVLLRNGGAQPLTSVQFNYSISGGPVFTYEWTGNLGIMESEEVILPIADEAFWTGDGENIFTVSISNPNGGTDENSINNELSSGFEMPQILKQNNRIRLNTNNRAFENRLRIYDINGNVVLEWDNLTNNTLYEDTLFFDPGCYTFELFDSGNDGLSYWADPNAGSGSVGFYHPKVNAKVKSFNSEFGRILHFPFFVEEIVGTNEAPTLSKDIFNIFPNPSTGSFTLDLASLSQNAELQVFNTLGSLVFSQSISTQGNKYRSLIDLNHLDKGVYWIKVIQNNREQTRKLILQ